MVSYTTKTWNGQGKQDYYWNEYRLDGNIVYKYKCHKYKFFDGKENNWESKETLEASWSIDDSTMPEWLKKHL